MHIVLVYIVHAHFLKWRVLGEKAIDKKITELIIRNFTGNWKNTCCLSIINLFPAVKYNLRKKN